MTVRRRTRWLLCLSLALVVGSGSGCRLFNKGGGSSADAGGWGSGSRDPLLGRDRIPATNLPTGRENAKGKRADPLLTSPSQESSDSEKLSSDLPPGGGSRKEPFRTGPETTAAGLARGPASDDPLLSVRAEESVDRRPTGSNTGRTGPVMLRGGGKTAGDNSADYDKAVADLKRYGVTVGEPLREGAEFILRGEVEAAGGMRRRYEGAGATATAAATDLLEQVRSDSGR